MRTPTHQCLAGSRHLLHRLLVQQQSGIATATTAVIISSFPAPRLQHGGVSGLPRIPAWRFHSRALSSTTAAAAAATATSSSSIATSEPGTAPTAGIRARVERDRLPKNDEITDRVVLLVSDDGEATVVDPHEVLRSLNLRVFDLRMISTAILPPREPPPPPPLLEEGEEPPPPPPEPRPAICRVVNKETEYQAKRAAKRRAREEREAAATGTGPPRKGKEKEVEISWQCGQNDLERKMRQARGWLEKGMRVTVVVVGKRLTGVEEGTEDWDRAMAKRAQEASPVVTKIRETLRAIPGIKELQTSDTPMGSRTMRLVWSR